MTSILNPGDTIGILGGGQLGRMLCIAAGRLGFRTIILEPGEDSPASQFANDQIVADYDDESALRELRTRCQAVTYEFENVPADAVEVIFGNGGVSPPVKALKISQDRLLEKQFVNELGIETAPFQPVEAGNLDAVVEDLGGRVILKTRRFGYDGKGQHIVGMEDLTGARSLLGEAAPDAFIAEGFVGFSREISVIAARSHSGEVACFDPAENVHKEGILRSSTVPASIGQETRVRATEIADRMLNALDYVGVIGIEFFCLENGALLVNEFAPRVHNSGHWTEASCAVSQFEQHIRAVAGFALGDPVRHSDCVMENLIGDDVEQLGDLVASSNTLVHLYGKAETRAGRKMGHFTRISPKTEAP